MNGRQEAAPRRRPQLLCLLAVSMLVGAFPLVARLGACSTSDSAEGVCRSTPCRHPTKDWPPLRSMPSPTGHRSEDCTPAALHCFPPLLTRAACFPLSNDRMSKGLLPPVLEEAPADRLLLRLERQPHCGVGALCWATGPPEAGHAGGAPACTHRHTRTHTPGREAPGCGVSCGGWEVTAHQPMTGGDRWQGGAADRGGCWDRRQRQCMEGPKQRMWVEASNN